MRVDFDCLVVWIVDLKLYALCFNETYCRFAYMWLLAVVENNIRIIIKTLSLNHEAWHTVRRISKHILRFEGSTFGSKDLETYPSTKDSILRAKIGSFDIFRPSLSNGLGPFLWYVIYVNACKSTVSFENPSSLVCVWRHSRPIPCSKDFIP